MSRRSRFVFLFCLTLACWPADPEGDPGSGGRGGSTGSAGYRRDDGRRGRRRLTGAAGRGGTTGGAGAAGTTGAAGAAAERRALRAPAGRRAPRAPAERQAPQAPPGRQAPPVQAARAAAGRGGTTGTAGRGGTTGTAGQGGTTGTAGMSGSGQGGAGGKSQTCLDIEAEYARVLPRFLIVLGVATMRQPRVIGPRLRLPARRSGAGPAGAGDLAQRRVTLVRRALHESDLQHAVPAGPGPQRQRLPKRPLRRLTLNVSRPTPAAAQAQTGNRSRA